MTTAWPNTGRSNPEQKVEAAGRSNVLAVRRTEGQRCQKIEVQRIEVQKVKVQRVNIGKLKFPISDSYGEELGLRLGLGIRDRNLG